MESSCISNEEIKQIWLDAQRFGQHTRSSKTSGLMAWRTYKEKFVNESRTIKIYQMALDLAKFYKNYFEDENERVLLTIDDNLVLDSNIETEHFITQLVRIHEHSLPRMTVQKFAQMAYNYGQFLASKDNGAYSQEVLMFMSHYDYLVKKHVLERTY